MFLRGKLAFQLAGRAILITSPSVLGLPGGIKNPRRTSFCIVRDSNLFFSTLGCLKQSGVLAKSIIRREVINQGYLDWVLLVEWA